MKTEMTKLPYDEWEKWYIDTQCIATEEDIEELKNSYCFGINGYEEFKRILKCEYQHYCESYDAALKVIKDNHIEKVKTYNLTLDEELK